MSFVYKGVCAGYMVMVHDSNMIMVHALRCNARR